MRPRTLDPILANAGTAAAYQRELDKMIKDLFRAHAEYLLDDILAVQGTVKDAKKLTPEEAAERFRKKADELALKFIAQNAKHVNAAFERSLLKAGFTKNDIRKMRKDKNAFETLIAQMREDNVALIRNIPEQVQEQIRASLNKSMEEHRDLASMYDDLKELEQMTIRRARNVTRDQNNKATEQLSRLTVQSLGITEGVWMHRSIGKTYRETHVAFNGQKFDLSQGLYDEDVGQFVLPAELPMCHCTYRPLIPDVL